MDRFRSPRLLSGWLVVGTIGGVTALWFRFNTDPSDPTRAALRYAHLGDFANYYLGMAEAVADRLRAGEWPLWNPHVCSGVPLLATLQNSVFYPGAWLPLALPTFTAFSWRIFIECCVAALFCTALFRAWGRHPAASAAGGFLYVFACVLGLAYWPPALSTVIWVPLQLLCVDRLTRVGDSRWWIVLTFGTALQLLAGFPQLAAYGWMLIAAVAVLHVVETAREPETPRGEMLRRGFLLVSAILLGVGLAAVQLGPTLELIGASMRPTAPGPESVHYLGSLLHRQHSALDVLRSAFDPTPKSISIGMGDAGGYLGTATAIGFGLGLWAGRREPRTWVLFALAAVTLLLSDGHLGPARGLYSVFAKLPLVGAFRTPERLRFVTLFCAIALAVRGFDSLLRICRPATSERAGMLVVALLACCAGVGVAMIGFGHASGVWRVAAVALLGWALLAVTRRPWRRAVVGLWLLLIVGDALLATAEQGFLRGLPGPFADYYGSRPGVSLVHPDWLARKRAEIEPGRIELVGFWPFTGTGVSRGTFRPSCYEPLAPEQWGALHLAITGKASMGQTLFDVSPADHPTYYDVTATKLILMSARTPGGERLVDNPDAVPRAYLVSDYRVVDRSYAIERVARGDHDFERVTLLDRDPRLDGGSPSATAPGEARISAYTPERVVVVVVPNVETLLVLTDTDFPGWKARVDGAPREIFRANGLYRAVRVSVGDRVVEFDYEPASFRVGLAVSALSLAICVVVTIATASQTGDAAGDPG